MNTSQRIEEIAKMLATGRSRRKMLQTAGAGMAAGLLGTATQDAAAQSTPVTEDTGHAFLFVQTAASGALMPNPDAGTAAAGGGAGMLLTMQGHHGGTIYFSDRPERRFGEAPTQGFLEDFGFTPFDPPNAALVIEGEEGGSEVIVLELIEPSYDAATGSITYGATILAEYNEDALAYAAAQQQDNDPSGSFGRASLFIDGCATYSQCMAWDPNMDAVGPVPGGPYDACYTQSKGCFPCDTSITYGHLCNLCDNTYAACKSSGGCLPTG